MPETRERLFAETVETIRPRILRDVIGDLDPTDPAFPDTTPGGFLSDVLGGAILEFERKWDALEEFKDATFIGTAFAQFLDERGAENGVDRKAESAAEVILTFTGTDGTQIPKTTEVEVVQTDPEAEEIVFQTAQAATITGGSVKVAAVAADVGARYNVPPNTLTLPDGENLDGVASVTNAEAASGGADPEDDETMRPRVLVAATQPRGGGTVADYRFWALERPSIGIAIVEPLFAGPGTVRVVIGSTATGPVGPLAVQALQAEIDPASVTATTQNPESFSGSDVTIEVPSTVGFRGQGFIYTLAGEVITYTGTTNGSFTGCRARNGLTIPAGTVLQQGGRGMGRAPIGALVAVSTFATLLVAAAIKITPADGYSIGPSAGKVDAVPIVQAAVKAYIDALGPGASVVRSRVAAAALATPAVFDVELPTLNGNAANIAGSSLVAPIGGTITVTAST